MTGEPSAPVRRTLTPAVLLAALFAAACALGSIGFVVARGGLQVPVAPSHPGVGLASPTPAAEPTHEPTAEPSTPAPGPSGAASVAPASVAPSLSPSVPPASPRPTPAADPLLSLPPCPGHPGCFVYTVGRGDTFSGVVARYGLLEYVVEALNPEVEDPGTIVVGQPLYLGRDPMARLEPCPGGAACRIYVVRPGDRVSTIADRFGVGIDAILSLNPSISDPNAIFSGQELRLPHPA